MRRWTVEPLDARVEGELLALPAKCQADFLRIAEMLCDFGPQQVGMPHVRALGNKLWEMRLRGSGSTARAIYIAAKGARLVVLHAFVKKTRKTQKRALDLARARAKEVE